MPKIKKGFLFQNLKPFFVFWVPDEYRYATGEYLVKDNERGVVHKHEVHGTLKPEGEPSGSPNSMPWEN